MHVALLTHIDKATDIRYPTYKFISNQFSVLIYNRRVCVCVVLAVSCFRLVWCVTQKT